MWRNRRIKWNNPYCILAILLTLSCLFIYLGFIFGNKFFMFGGIGSDTKSQYVMWYSSIADKLRTGTFSLWDFKNGFGANISIEGIYDPFQILICLFGALFGSSAIPHILIYVNILKIVLAGLFMFYFLNCFKISSKVKIITSYMYAFNGFMMVWGQHYHLATIVVYLPLLFAAVEQTLYNKKRWPFVVFATAIIGAYSLYFCYMSLITVGIYGIARILQLNCKIKDKFKIVFRQIFSVLLGLALSCFALLPSAYVISNVSIRTSSDVNIFQRLISSFILFPKEYYKMLFYRMFSSNLQGTINYVGYINYYEALNFCCSNLLVFLMLQYVFLIFRKSTPKKEKLIKISIIAILTFALLLPTAGLIYNGFVYCVHRWSFAVIPILIILSAKTLDEIISSKKISIVGTICYFILSSIVYLKAFKRFCVTGETILQLNTVILFLTGFMIIIGICLFIKHKFTSQVLCVLLLNVVCINLVSDSFISANYMATVKKNDTYISNVYNEDIKEAISYLKQSDPTFFRIEKTFISEPLNMMDPLAQNYYGINTYNSVINKNILKFNENIWKNIQIGSFSYQCFNNAKQDHLKASLVGLKYILANNKDEQINGFKKIGEFGNITVLKNDYDISLGRLYTKSISEKVFEENQCNFDNVLADAVILDESSNFDVSSSDLAIYKNKKQDGQLLKSFQTMPLAQFEVNGNDSYLVSTANIPQDGILLITIPYEGGWKAYVDGQETDILKADYGFSAIKLDKGTHYIELKFSAPWFKEGIIISLLALLILIILLFYHKKRKKEVVSSNDQF